MRRQKVVQPTYRIENEYDPEAMPQYFQVTVVIIEEKIYAWTNTQPANSYVIVALGKQRRRTSIRRNMLDTSSGEMISFELYTSISRMEQLSLSLTVMESQSWVTPRIIGEARIELRTIWTQPFHQVLHKWLQLYAPNGSTSGTIGFLKMDMTVLLRGEINVRPGGMFEDDFFEGNLLLPSGSEQQRTNYIITIQRAFGLLNDSRTCRRGLGKPPSTYVKVSFCGLVAKTAVQPRNNNPKYCEQISMVEMFPNINQFIRFDLYSARGTSHNVIATINLALSDISHDGDYGYLPTFGPTLVHMYGTAATGESSKESPFYKGALIFSLETVVPYYKQSIGTVCVKHVKPIKLENLWTIEDFIIYCPIFEVSMIDPKIAGNSCGVAITIGEIPYADNGEFQDMIDEMKSRKLHYTGSLEVVNADPTYGYMNFRTTLPVLQLASRLPDIRTKMYKNNVIQGIVNDLDAALNTVEDRLINSPNFSKLIDELKNVTDDATAKIVKYLAMISVPIAEINCSDYYTELELKQMKFQKEEIEKIYNIILEARCCVQPCTAGGTRELKKAVKLILRNIRHTACKLRHLLLKPAVSWPDIVFWLLSGGTRVAYAKLSPADIIYSTTPQESGGDCGRIQTLCLKPLNCPKHRHTNCCCIACKVESLCWMGLFDQRSSINNYIPNGFALKMKDCDVVLKVEYTDVSCQAFVCKAKLNQNESASLQYFVRINAFNQVKETQVQKGPVLSWNELIHINSMLPTTFKRLTMFPPLLIVELFTFSKGKLKLVGRVEKLPVVFDTVDIEKTPNLIWDDLYKGTENTGKLLMSALIFQVPEKVIKTTTYRPRQETYYTNNCIRDCDDVPLLRSSPNFKSYKIDVSWWGLREVSLPQKAFIAMEIEDVTIESETLCNNNPNRNFQNKTYRLFDTPLGSLFTFNIKIYHYSTFGRRFLLGSSVIKNPSKYFINWLPQSEYETLTNGVPINSSEFIQANKTMFIKRSSEEYKENIIYDKELKIRIRRDESYFKRTNRKSIFWRRNSDEEEILLPMNRQSTYTGVDSRMEQDWWLRYLRSKENTHADKICLIVYESELESRPEFFKFKDWCATIKLYNGKKTGISETDEVLFCGYLKTGIAIYKWPPIPNTVVVSSSGVNLDRGYFYEHPKNNFDKFLVRVYIVKGVSLTISDCNEKSGIYVTLCCGRKSFGDRDKYVPNSLNPIFGNMLELSCNMPDDYLLTISIYHCDQTSLDTLIGSTSIDLENRIYSKHRARVGLASKYSLSDPGKWRDCLPPSAILEDICRKNHIPLPVYPDSTTVIFNGIEYRNSNHEWSCESTEIKENLCLAILHKWHTLPVCGYSLVPEHVETRTLFHPDKLGEQGKIEMWVDIFPLSPDTILPAAVNITPRRVENYELCLTVYKVRTEKGIRDLHKNRRPIYFKTWLGSAAHSLNSNVYYETIGDDININYQMTFNFQYQPSIKKLITKQTGSTARLEEYVPPILMIQLHNDTLSSNDYIGALMLNLNDMSRGAKRIGECKSEHHNRSERVNLFSASNILAWWPLQTIDNVNDITGKVKIDLTLLAKNEENVNTTGIQTRASKIMNEENPCFIRIIRKMVRGKGDRNKHCCAVLITILCMVAILLCLSVILISFGPTYILEHWLIV